MDFSGKTVIVTGAGGGIGEGYARACADRGMNVVIAELSEEGGKRVADTINAEGGTALFVQTDVQSSTSPPPRRG
jgi:NAD(P)-dependent dehydrogenase (short-subunit alcohol dehydrogenase family)